MRYIVILIMSITFIVLISLILLLYLNDLINIRVKRIIKISLLSLFITLIGLFFFVSGYRKKISSILPNEKIKNVYYMISINKDINTEAYDFLKDAYKVSDYDRKGIMYIKELDSNYFSDYNEIVESTYYRPYTHILTQNIEHDTYYICIQYENYYCLVGNKYTCKLYNGNYLFDHDNYLYETKDNCIKNVLSEEGSFSNLFSMFKIYYQKELNEKSD